MGQSEGLIVRNDTMVPCSSRGHTNLPCPLPPDALQDKCSRRRRVWANQVYAGSVVEYVWVLSLHRPVPWEIVPRPTSASGFTVPTRRAVIEAPGLAHPGRHYSFTRANSSHACAFQAQRTSTWSHGKIWAT